MQSRLFFNADFETGNLSQWGHVQQCPGSISVVPDPLRSGNLVGKFTVGDDDVRENCPQLGGSPTSDPRAQTMSPKLLQQNGEYYVSFSVFFPSDFPVVSDWFGVMQIYGQPWGGTPTVGFSVSNNRLTFHSAQTTAPGVAHTTVWQGPQIARGARWESIVLRLKMSTDPSVGFAEIWHNGAKQSLAGGVQTYYFRTLDPGRNWDGADANMLYAQQYRSRNMVLGEVSVYHDNYKIGNTYDSVTK